MRPRRCYEVLRSAGEVTDEAKLRSLQLSAPRFDLDSLSFCSDLLILSPSRN